MSIFANCKPLTARWLKLGEEQTYPLEGCHKVSFSKDDLHDIITVKNTCFDKTVFSMVLAADVFPIDKKLIKGIVVQPYIKCDYDSIPVVEDGKVVIIGRVVRYLV